MTQPFEEFAKIPRLKRNCVITEKIDGTNAQVHVTDEGEVLAGSRSRYITPEEDNFGFAKWVAANREALQMLGPGRHFGEWWGSGVQRGYGLTKGEKRFSLFNVGRWKAAQQPHHEKCSCGSCPATTDAILPPCVGLVPVLYEGPFGSDMVDLCISNLRFHGSVAAPGFMKPEGIIVYHAAARSMFKVTLEKDEAPKGLAGL